MASVVISEGIILIASILVAIAISGVIITKIGVFESTFTAQSEAQQDLMLTKIKVIYATDDSGSGEVNVWVKNIGSQPITQLTSMDVYFGEIGAVDSYGYSLTPSAGEWEFDVGTPPISWEIGETIQMNIDYSGSLTADTTHTVRITTSNGIIDDYIFTPI